MPKKTVTKTPSDVECWWLYVLQCADGSLYTGITTDVGRRVGEHNAGPKGARYTRARRPVAVVSQWPLPNRSAATKAEGRFKALTRSAKLKVMAGKRPLPWGPDDHE